MLYYKTFQVNCQRFYSIRDRWGTKLRICHLLFAISFYWNFCNTSVKWGLQNQPIKFVNLQETMNYIHSQLLSDFLYIHLVWTTFVYLDVFRTKLCWFFLGLNKTTTHLVKKITGIVNFQLYENVQEEIADTFA